MQNVGISDKLKGVNKMFYKVLFILTILNFVLDFNVRIKTYGKIITASDKLSVGACIAMGSSMLFYLMVIALTLIPALILL